MLIKLHYSTFMAYRISILSKTSADRLVHTRRGGGGGGGGDCCKLDSNFSSVQFIYFENIHTKLHV